MVPKPKSTGFLTTIITDALQKIKVSYMLPKIINLVRLPPKVMLGLLLLRRSNVDTVEWSLLWPVTLLLQIFMYLTNLVAPTLTPMTESDYL